MLIRSNKLKYLLVVLVFPFLFGSKGFSQELNCAIDIITANLPQQPEASVIEGLKTGIFDFMNNTKWTKDKFEPHEKIECSIIISLTNFDGNSGYKGTIQIQSRRPVFNSSYSTPLFNYIDEDFAFTYTIGTQFLFTADRFQSNLTAVLAYYANIILAYDYDTFSDKGGTPYFQVAQTIANQALSSALGDHSSGWESDQSNSNKNRYWLVDNALQQLFSPLRSSYYKYHRLGLDVLYDDVNKGLQNMIQAIQLLQNVQRARPASFNLQLFFLAKRTEIIKVFTKAEARYKNQVYNLVTRMDPAYISRYDKMKK